METAMTAQKEYLTAPLAHLTTTLLFKSSATHVKQALSLSQLTERESANQLNAPQCIKKPENALGVKLVFSLTLKLESA
jgi:hypothetical protein